jgi:hypothetical protein
VHAQTQARTGVFEVLLQQLGQICRAHLVLRDDDDANMGPRVDVPTRPSVEGGEGKALTRTVLSLLPAAPWVASSHLETSFRNGHDSKVALLYGTTGSL